MEKLKKAAHSATMRKKHKKKQGSKSNLMRNPPQTQRVPPPRPRLQQEKEPKQKRHLPKPPASRPPSKQKGASRKPAPKPVGASSQHLSLLESLSPSELKKPFSGDSEQLRRIGQGRPGVLGWFCYRCKAVLADSGASDVPDSLLKCLNCDRITTRLISGRLRPSKKRGQATVETVNRYQLSTSQNALLWFRVFTADEEKSLVEDIERLRGADVSSLTSLLTEKYSLTTEAVENLDSLYPLERKEELVQYVVSYQTHATVWSDLGYVIAQKRNGDTYWRMVGDYVLDPELYTDYGGKGLLVPARDIMKVSRTSFEVRLSLLSSSAVMFL